MKQPRNREILLILHNIRSVHNVASIFRTADCAGVSRIYLTGYTPTPADRFGRARRDFAKVSLGAERTVPWEAWRSALLLLAQLKKEGVKIIAVEQNPRAIDYRVVRARGNCALVFGNEVRGLSETVLRRADTIAEIPLRGAKESLNVAVAAGIVIFNMHKNLESHSN